MNIRGRALIVACALMAGLLPGFAAAAVPSEFALTSIQRTSPDQMGPEETVEATYTTSGPREANFVRFVFLDRIGGQLPAYGWDGSVSGYTNMYEPSALHTLDYVYLNFSEGDEHISIYYRRDGTVEYYADDYENPTQGAHSLDFDALDFSVNNPSEDVTIPALDSFEVARTEGLQPGDDIRIDFDAPEGVAPLYSIRFTYEAPDGRLRDLFGYDSGSDDTLENFLTRTVKKGWMGGTHILKTVRLYDDAGLQATYRRDGTIGKTPVGAEGPNVHTLDLTAGDVTIDNPDPDLVAPQLLSIAQETDGVYYPGEDAVLQLGAEEDSIVENVSMSWYSEASFAWFSGTLSEEDDEVVVNMSFWFEPGIYDLERIALTDDGENTKAFYGDGVTYDSTTGSEGSHGVSFSPGDFEIVPWPHSFVSSLSTGGIDIDFGTGQFRFVLQPWFDESHVQVATITALPGGAFRAEYSADGIVLDGIFEPATGSFAAEYEEGGIGYSLVGGPSKVPPPPVPTLP